MRWTELFGPILLGQEGGKFVFLNTESHLEGKHVLLFFSGHWDPPVR
jgi:hypothetical protein